MDNPSAFPQGNEWIDAEGNMRLAHEGGMTLRDYFAGQSLAFAAHSEWFSSAFEDQAERAYRMADAMIAERSKPEVQL